MTPNEPRQMTDEELQLVIDQIVRNRSPQDLAAHADYQKCLEEQRSRHALGVLKTKDSFHHPV